MPLQFAELILSMRQPVLPKLPTTPVWAERFFWSDGLALLDATNGMLQRLPELNAAVQAKFWQGQVPAELLKFLPAHLEAVSAERIIEYARAWESQRTAMHLLTIKARSEKLAPDGQLRFGGLRIDAKSYALHLAKCWKTVGARGVPRIIGRAAEANDVQFFKQLGRALAEKVPVPEVDWSKPNATACFLAQYWCQPSDYARWLPALCFFADQALADFCSAAFGENPGEPSVDAVRQWRRRFGLKPVRWPKIRQVTVKNNEIMFA